MHSSHSKLICPPYHPWLPVLYSSPAEVISLLLTCPALPPIAVSPELFRSIRAKVVESQLPNVWHCRLSDTNRTSFPSKRSKPAVRLGVMAHAHSPSTWEEEVGRLSCVHDHSRLYREHQAAWVTEWLYVSNTKTKLSKIKPSIYSLEMRVFLQMLGAYTYR